MNDEAAISTYRYLRIGLVGAVVLLLASVLLERAEVDCWQRSISAYYYTPVRAIFVGSLMAVGMAMIVIKGRTDPIDIGLNFAGMLAPIVAVAPTTNVGICFSEEPDPLPVDANGDLAEWVIANIDNNMSALLITAIVGLLVAALIAAIAAGHLVVRWGLLITLALVILVTMAFVWWDDFYTKAHGIAAIGMFLCLIFVVAWNAREVKGQPGSRRYFLLYAAIAGLMLLVPLILLPFSWDHKVLILEAIEISLFGVFWLVQTAEFGDGTSQPATP